MSPRLTRCERAILEEIERRGEIKSFYRLTVDLGMAYYHATRCLRRLERAGLLSVIRRGPGSPLVISIPDSHRPVPVQQQSTIAVSEVCGSVGVSFFDFLDMPNAKR